MWLLGPSFATNGARPSFAGDRMRRLLADADASGWEEALGRFTGEVLSGALAAPAGSGLARARARLFGATWEDTLQDLVDPTRAGWKFLLDIRPTARVLFLGPSWGAAPLVLARSAAHLVVLDGSAERLRLVRHLVSGMGLDNVTLARVVDPLGLPLADASMDAAVVPDLAEWFTAIAGERPLPTACGAQLLVELRRVLAPGGQVYIAAENRHGVARLLGGRWPRGARFSPRSFRTAASEAGFAACGLFAPIPFPHKFHQVLDLERVDRMNFSADPYRTRGRAVRRLIKAWDACNRNGGVERRLYPFLPALAAVLSTEPATRPFAERLLEHLGSDGAPGAAGGLSRYYVRPRGVAVLVTGGAAGDGVVVRLPLEERAERTCARHHRALEAFAADARLSALLKRLFPRPLAQGRLDGQAYFAESALPGESGRLYYSRPGRRYDRAIVQAAGVLGELRRATEQPVAIDEAEFSRLVGQWLVELRAVVREESRDALAAIERWLRATLVGATLPLGWYHGDYDLANLLYTPRDAVAGILDFEVFDPRGLPLIDLLLLLARRAIRREGLALGTLVTRVILPRALGPLEAELLAQEVRLLGADERLYRALALCGWLCHLRLRRDSWLARSPSWLEANLHAVVEDVRDML